MVKKKNIAVWISALMPPLDSDAKTGWHIDSKYSFLWPKNMNKLSSLIDQLIKEKENGTLIINSARQLGLYKKYYNNPMSFVFKDRECNMVDIRITIGSEGEVSLCSEFGPIGNIKSNTLSEIWYSNEARRVRQKVKKCRINCCQALHEGVLYE